MRYTFENVLNKASLRPVANIAAALNGVAVDTEGFGDGMMTVDVGATTGSPTSFTVAAKVQESADGSTGWVDITGAAITTITVAAKSAEAKISLRKKADHLRYVRSVVTVAFVGGSTPTIGVASNIILGNAEVGSDANNSIVGD